MKKKTAAMICLCSFALALPVSALAAPEVSGSTARSYDQVVDLMDGADDLDVTIEEVVSVAGQAANSEKTINVQTSQMSSDDSMTAAIEVKTGDGDQTQYYEDGYLYTDQENSQTKYSMSQDIMKQLLDRYIYLNLTSEYLSGLQAEKKEDGSTTYSFTASEETIAGYEDRLLEGIQAEHEINIVSIEGTVETDKDGNLKKRDIEMVYTVNSGDQSQMCVLTSNATFHNTAEETVEVELPKELENFDEKAQNTPAIEITKEERTIYATDDLNIRAQNSVTAAVLGGIEAGGTIEQIGYTNDGWIQIRYNDVTAYVYAEYTSQTKPVIVKEMGGSMYATAPVNVRSSYSTDSKILGTLETDDEVTTTGYTDNGWIRVKYNGKTAYINQSYLTWTVPQHEEDNDVYTGYLEGRVTDTGVNTVVVQTMDGMVYNFSTAHATEITSDGIVIGDWVGVTYKNRNGKYIASEVEDFSYDYTQRSSMTQSGYRDQVSYGTVIAYDLNQIIIALENGMTLSADLENVTIDGELYNGAYVIANYIGSYLYAVTKF
ncbi:MAG: SH3 domain-containing protein [Eubacteriales bacterium]|nr:SH3 domain-containing protein [Eubacteriales bacterium]